MIRKLHNYSKTRLFEPITVVIGIGAGVFFDEAMSNQKKQVTDQQIRAEITVDLAGAPTEVVTVVDHVRDLAKGEQRTNGIERAFTRSVQFERGYEIGSSRSVSAFVGASIEEKVAQDFAVQFGQQVNHTYSVTVNGDVCPRYDVIKREFWIKGQARAPSLSDAPIPFRYLDKVDIRAVNLCTTPGYKPS